MHYWGGNPPPHVMLRAKWGFERPKTAPAEINTQENLDAFLAAFGGAGGQVVIAKEG